MANPRQRRKLRSGSHKPVHHSRRAKKILKKQPPIRAPKVLQESWDNHKTVRQNYEALGLVTSLNPTSSGGVEKPLNMHMSGCADSPMPEPSSSAAPASNSVPKGYGRIIRDEDGNIVDVQMGEEEAEETPADGMLDDLPDPTRDEQLAGWVGLGSHPSTQQLNNATITPVVQALEEISKASGSKRPPRFTSAGEAATLRRLIQKHKDDVESMARDRKLNRDQRTPGELHRAITKAGGFAALATGV
ncbi:ribosome biogenesis protein Nop16 [Sparassis latifolia]